MDSSSLDNLQLASVCQLMIMIDALQTLEAQIFYNCQR